jgi:hypothetical protein
MASNRESIRRSSEVTASRNDKQALSHARERLSVFVHPFLQARQALFQSRHAILRKDAVVETTTQILIWRDRTACAVRFWA